MSDMQADAVVIGAGVVGLAVAKALAQLGREVLVLERNLQIGAETSSRNSEVIHAGIYYPAGSNKARLCVRGKELLYEHCHAHGVPHNRCGKLIVATSAEQRNTLHEYTSAARTNGAGLLRWVECDELSQLEPAVTGLAGILSPTTGIIDSHQYMLSLQGLLEASGGVIAFDTAVSHLEVQAPGVCVHSQQGSIHCQTLINCAGLWAPGLGATIDANTPTARYAIGHYYSYAGTPFKHLIYPVAEAGGLGIHVTFDLGGQTRFGPDVRWLERVDYSFDDSARDQFVSAIRRYYPDLDATRLQPGYTGIRPKLAKSPGAAEDFVLRGPADHGVAGFINLLGIESPGLTASLAIAEWVVETLETAAGAG
jgi:L-2-hydroxyglutarate oxidase LhgO